MTRRPCDCCIDCGKTISNGSKRCRSCSGHALKSPGVISKRSKTISILRRSDLDPYVESSLLHGLKMKRAWGNPNSKLNSPECRMKLADAAKSSWGCDGALRNSVSKISNAAKRNWKLGKYSHLRWGKISKLEQSFADAMTKLGVLHIHQFLPADFHKPVDFLILGTCLVVEIDGDYWHGRPWSEKRDNDKDDWYNAHGYSVLRIPEHELRRLGADCVISEYILSECNPHG